MPKLCRGILALAVALVVAGPAFGYTVYLKDGSRMIAREAPRVEGGKAYIVLQNGATTSIDADEIDVARTNEVNKSDYGTAIIIENGKIVMAPKTALPKQEKRLSDLINQGTVGQRSRPQARRTVAPTPRDSRDLARTNRTPYRGNLDISSEIQNVFRGLGVEEVGIYQGTQTDRLLLEVGTNSESAVFRSLKAAAGALRHIRGTYPQDVTAFELVMTTSNNGRAGQFVLTPDLAETLLAEGADVSAFFVRNVQF